MRAQPTGFKTAYKPTMTDKMLIIYQKNSHDQIMDQYANFKN